MKNKKLLYSFIAGTLFTMSLPISVAANENQSINAKIENNSEVNLNNKNKLKIKKDKYFKNISGTYAITLDEYLFKIKNNESFLLLITSVYGNIEMQKIAMQKYIAWQ